MDMQPTPMTDEGIMMESFDKQAKDLKPTDYIEVGGKVIELTQVLTNRYSDKVLVGHRAGDKNKAEYRMIVPSNDHWLGWEIPVEARNNVVIL